MDMGEGNVDEKRAPEGEVDVKEGKACQRD